MSTLVAVPDPAVPAATRSSLRICFYTLFAAGGIGRYTHELMKEMASMPGLDVELVCSPEFQWADGTYYPAWTGMKNLSHRIPTLRRFNFLSAQLVNPRLLFERARATKADVVHLSNINHVSFPFWRQLLERSGAKLTITAHDVRRRKAIILPWWDDSQLRAVYQRADAIFVHSNYQARELEEFASVDRARVHIVPHGPYPYEGPRADRKALRNRYELPDDVPVVLFFGQMRDEKNLRGLLEAARYCSEDFHILVAGKQGSRSRGMSYYRRLCKRLGLTERVRFLDRYIPDEEVGDVFHVADCVSLPYTNEFTSQSGVLNVAAHFERPVHVSSSPVLKETVEGTDVGVTSEGDDPRSLAMGLDRLLKRVREGHAHDFEGYRRRYSWSANARITAEVYHGLVRG